MTRIAEDLTLNGVLVLMAMGCGLVIIFCLFLIFWIMR